LIIFLCRSALACAAACTAGIATASSLGAIKLWTADSLVCEAEKGGLILPTRPLVSEGSRWVRPLTTSRA
jgi:hypothetical protein